MNNYPLEFLVQIRRTQKDEDAFDLLSETKTEML